MDGCEPSAGDHRPLSGRPGARPERGYRGWAKTVFEEALAA